MMKKNLMLSGAILLIALMVVPSAFALSISAGDIITFEYTEIPNPNSDRFSSGGVFKATHVDSGTIFQTFCLEANEKLGDIVADISTAAIQGGNTKGTTNFDPIEAETAYLFNKFWDNAFFGPIIKDGGTGVMAGWQNSAGENYLKRDLQEAIWYLENEITSIAAGGNAAQLIAEAQSAIAANTWSGIGNVRVMNMTNAAGDFRQSTLVKVPEPATLLFLGLGMIGFGIAGRRKFRNS